MNVSYQFKSFIFFCLLLSIGACNSEKAKTSSDKSTLEKKEASTTKSTNEVVLEDGEPKVVDSPVMDAIEEPVELSKDESPENVPPKKSAPKPAKKKKKKVKKYAKMTFDSVIHHLPSVIEGDNFKNKFVFKNTGEVPLSISGASSSCGCTTPNYSFLDIAPGEVSSIGVDYFSVNKDGPQEAEIVIKANTYPPETTLKMLFTVLPREEDEKAKKDTLSN